MAMLAWFHKMCIRVFDWWFPHPSQGRREKFILESHKVKDSFEIWVDLPDLPEEELKGLPVMVYTDANLPSMCKLNTVVREMREAGQLPPVILVGVAHHDSFLWKRNRDLLHGRRRRGNFFRNRRQGTGQAEKFYRFLEGELAPEIRRRYQPSENWTFLGHSFGGSFALYTMLHHQPLFRHYLALSPAVWVYNRSLLKAAAHFKEKSGELRGNVYLSAGSWEAFNLVLHSAQAYHRMLKAESHLGLRSKMDVFPRKNHFSSVVPGIRNGLSWLRLQGAFKKDNAAGEIRNLTDNAPQANRNSA